MTVENGQRPQFSLKALLITTTVFGVAVYVLRTWAFVLILVHALLPLVVGYAIRLGGMWLPDGVRPWAAVLGLCLGSVGLTLIQMANHEQDFDSAFVLLFLAMPAWLPQLFLMDRLIRRVDQP